MWALRSDGFFMASFTVMDERPARRRLNNRYQLRQRRQREIDRYFGQQRAAQLYIQSDIDHLDELAESDARHNALNIIDAYEDGHGSNIANYIPNYQILEAANPDKLRERADDVDWTTNDGWRAYFSVMQEGARAGERLRNRHLDQMPTEPNLTTPYSRTEDEPVLRRLVEEAPRARVMTSVSTGPRRSARLRPRRLRNLNPK